MKMKTVKLGLILISALFLAFSLSNTASAHSRVSVGVGFGFPVYNHGFNHHYYGRHYYPYWGPVVVGGSYWYDWGPDYYVDAPPTVVERAPVVIERKTVFAQPQGVNENTFKDLRYKKNELLKKLETDDKAQRKEAISKLAGFSFDDNVRQALENILLSDPDVELRIGATQALVEVKNVKALPALEKARVEDSDANVRKAADQAISKIEGAAS
jgi:hypothetical protein